MDIQTLANWSYGVQNYLMGLGYDVSGSGAKLNKIMVMYLKDRGLPYKKWNWRYKGLRTADLINAEPIQNNWADFTKWAKEL